MDRRLVTCLCVLAGCRDIFDLRSPTVESPDGATDGDGMTGDAPVDMPVSDMWWDPSFSRRRLIQIDTSGLPGDVVDFPLPINLTATNFNFGNAKPNGDDVRFVAADNVTPIAYELDTWTPPTLGLVWVRVSLRRGQPAQLWMYYGKSSATAASDGPALFGDNVSASHMRASEDSSGHNHLLLSSGSSIPAAGPGVFANGRTFDGLDDYIALMDSDAPYDFTQTLTVSAWVRITSFDIRWQTIVAKGDHAWRLHRENQTDTISAGTTSAANLHTNLPATTIISGGAWHHVAMRLAANTLAVFVDGHLEGSVAYTATLQNTGASVTFGRNEDVTPMRHWNGDIDEVRIASVARSDAWIGAEAWAAGPTIVVVGAEQTGP